MIAALLAAVLVATPTNVQAQINGAPAGATILLSTGSYPELRVYNRSAPLTINATAPGVVVSQLEAANGVAPDVLGGTWGPAQFAVITFNTTTAGSVKQAHVIGAGTVGISLNNEDGATIQWVAIRASGADGVDCSSCRNTTISDVNCAGNLIDTNHPDCVQTWDVAGLPIVSNLKVVWSIAVGPTDGFTAFASAGGFTGVTVDDNIYAGSSSWAAGKWLACTGCEMLRNVAYTGNILPANFQPPSWFLNGVTASGNTNGPRPGATTAAVP